MNIMSLSASSVWIVQIRNAFVTSLVKQRFVACCMQLCSFHAAGYCHSLSSFSAFFLVSLSMCSS